MALVFLGVVVITLIAGGGSSHHATTITGQMRSSGSSGSLGPAAGPVRVVAVASGRLPTPAQLIAATLLGDKTPACAAAGSSIRPASGIRASS